jgi:hypothetical protein
LAKKNWLLHHDNALSHTSFLTREFFTMNKMNFNPHPPYFHGMAPHDFFLIEDKTEKKPF